MQKIEYGRYYHIYNRGINSCNLFEENMNYEYFLNLYEKYVYPIADTYAWCLMKNHFHFLVRIKEKNELKYLPPKTQNPDKSKKRLCRVNNQVDPSGSERPDGVLYTKKLPIPENQFGHLFNAYAKAFNKKYGRTGSLFERPFCRILIEDNSYLKYLVYYIHHNPVKHGFVEDMIEYPWSSFLSVLSPKQTHLKRKDVINWFDGLDNLKYFHRQEHDLENIKNLI